MEDYISLASVMSESLSKLPVSVESACIPPEPGFGGAVVSSALALLGFWGQTQKVCCVVLLETVPFPALSGSLLPPPCVWGEGLLICEYVHTCVYTQARGHHQGSLFFSAYFFETGSPPTPPRSQPFS